MTNQTVGERLRRFRVEILGMSQLDLAAKLGIDPASLNRIERGKRRPDHNTLVESGSHHQTHQRQTPAGHSKPLSGRAFRPTSRPTFTRTKLAVILSFIRRYSPAVVQIVCKRQTSATVKKYLTVRPEGSRYLWSRSPTSDIMVASCYLRPRTASSAGLSFFQPDKT